MDDWYLDGKSIHKWQQSQYHNYDVYKESQIALGLYSMLLTLHGWFMVNIEQDE